MMGQLCGRSKVVLTPSPLGFCNDAGNTVTEKGHQDAAELPELKMPGRQRQWTGPGIL